MEKPPPTEQKVLALYDYKARAMTELSFKAGDWITVEGQWDKIWWKGSVGDEVGFFPANYVAGLDKIKVEEEPEEDESKADWQDDEYFDSYATLTIHHQMLTDVLRTTCYQRAVEKFSHKIKGKIVLDIGCGSGILSIFTAKAGAKHVYAVDASDIIRIAARKVIKANGLENQITTIHGKIEEITLPVDKVDVIISEWMGTFLVCESMIDSVLRARQLYLKDDGIMMPSTANLFVCPLSNDQHYDNHVNYWKDVYGVDMSCLQDMAKETFFEKPTYTRCIDREELMSDKPAVAWHMDMGTATAEDLEKHLGAFECVINRTGRMHGFGIWFDTWFTGDSAKERANRDSSSDNSDGEYGPDEDSYSLILSTSPYHTDTHWKQVIFWLKTPIEVEKGAVIKGTLHVLRNEKWRRHFDCEFKFRVHTKTGSSEAVSEELTIFYNMWRG